VAVVNSGFDGTVTESSFAKMMRGAGLRDSVATSAAWLVTQGTGRQVSVAAGTAYATGVVSVSDAAQLASLPTPVNGQWHLVVRRVNWTSNTVTVETIPHTVTTATIPTVAPETYPTFNDSAGSLLDQKLAWAWVRSSDTTVAVFNLRALSLDFASTTVTGIVELATGAETVTGTDATRAVTPAGLASLASVSLFNGSVDGDSNVTLSLPLTNFPYVTIFFKDNDGYSESIDLATTDCVVNTSSSTASNYVFQVMGGTTTAYIKRRVVYFYSTTSLRNVSTQFLAVSGSTWATNNTQILITRVVGHY
jgi:hypothetical protein